MSKHIESDIVHIGCKPEKVYNFISSFDNFTSLLPDKVENWQSTGDSCSFEVKGLAALGFMMPVFFCLSETDTNLKPVINIILHQVRFILPLFVGILNFC